LEKFEPVDSIQEKDRAIKAKGYSRGLLIISEKSLEGSVRAANPSLG
jgi:hypothetical protein